MMKETINISNLINKPLENINFLIDKFENMPEPENYIYPHKHSFYEIFWITKGKSSQGVDYKNYKIGKNTLFFISPGQIHHFQDWEDLDGFVVLFTEDFLLKIFQNKNILFELSFIDNLHENPFIKVKKKDIKTLHSIFDMLYIFKSCEDSTRALLLVLLKNIQKINNSDYHNNIDKTKISLLKNFKKLVELNFVEKISIAKYASFLNVSPHHLNLVVKELTGKTCTEIVSERTILEAKQLLHFSEFNINQIAEKTGFLDSNYFSRFFKNKTGFTPNNYRKKI